MLGKLFTFFLTYGGAAAALFQPHYALLVYVCFAIVKPESMWPWSVEPWHYSRIVGVALLVGWAVHGFGKWEFGKAGGVVAALVLYGLWIVLSASFAPDQGAAWYFAEKQAKIILPFVAGITLIDTVAKLKQLAWVMILSQGMLANRMHDIFFLRSVEFAGTDVYNFSGLDNNSLAIGMCTCVGLAFFMGLTVERWWQRVICFLSAALMAHAVLFMFSRGGMVALVVTGLVSLVLIPRQPKHYMYFALAVIVALIMAGPGVRDRFFSAFVDQKTRDEAASSRLRQWGYCVDAIQEHPVLGVGPDHWPLSQSRKFNKDGGEAHSLWLHVAAELGVPGFLFLVLFYGITMLRLYPLTQARDFPGDPWLQGAARMVIASLVGFVVSAQFVSLKDLEQPFYVTLIGAGVLRLASAKRPEPAPEWTTHEASGVA